MTNTIDKNMTVGALVADNFQRAAVFQRLGIDYCCHGSDTLAQACDKAGVTIDAVAAQLDAQDDENTVAPNFSKWPLDLVIDYVLKVHHRNFHAEHAGILELVKKVERAHGQEHPELHTLRQTVEDSFEELEMHFRKEEEVLFPHLYDMYAAHEAGVEAPPFHCGSILPPIRQMMVEHDTAGEVWHGIARLTENFTTPTDGCSAYRLMNSTLRKFFLDIQEHISLENNIIFPGFLKMEQEG